MCGSASPRNTGGRPVNLMCEAFGISRSGFYAWLTRPRIRRSLSDEALGAQVRQSFVRSDRAYGARRVWRDVLEQGQPCGLHRIERLMREQALRARPRQRGLPKDRGARSAVANNVLDRQFQAGAPNQKWVADFTYIWIAEGWLYVATVLGLYSRRVVNRSMQESMTSQLAVDALMTAVWRRGKPVALLHHSDHGSQYTSWHFQQLLRKQGRRGLGQLGHGELPKFNEDRTHGQEGVSQQWSKPALTCSITSSTSTTGCAAIRRWATSAPYSSSKLKKLRAASMKPAAAHFSEQLPDGSRSDYALYLRSSSLPI